MAIALPMPDALRVLWIFNTFWLETFRLKSSLVPVVNWWFRVRRPTQINASLSSSREARAPCILYKHCSGSVDIGVPTVPIRTTVLSLETSPVC